jgi:ATP phosphoribosyltransferase
MAGGNQEKTLLIGIPKGSLEEPTIALFAKAGIRLWGSDRSLWLSSNDDDLRPVLLRPQEIPKYVEQGALDCGLAGYDWILESGCNGRLKLLTNLCYSKRSFRPVRWVLAVPEDSGIHSTSDLRQDPPIRVSTELENVTKNWLSEQGVVANVMFSWGATEAKAPVFADAIVECTETGSSLRANRLRIIDTILESTTRFFANRAVYGDDTWKRKKIDALSLLLTSCLKAEGNDCLRFSVSREKMTALEALIPPGIQYAVFETKDGSCTFELIADRLSLKDLVPALIGGGAERLIVSPLEMTYDGRVPG